MIVGFTITNYNKHEKDAIAFIRKVCMLEDPSIADNIVACGAGIHVYANGLTESLLLAQPFTCEPIQTINDRRMVISTVNFKVEFTYNGIHKVLEPTEYMYVPLEKSAVGELIPYYKEGLIRFIPEL